MDAALEPAVLDSLPAQLALLDHGGTVVLVNKQWRQYAELADCSRCGEGSNFFDVCGRAYGSAVADATRAAEGLRKVLGG